MTVIVRVTLSDGTFKALALTNSTTAEQCREQLIRRLCKDENSRTSEEELLKTRDKYQRYQLYRSVGSLPAEPLASSDLVWCAGNFTISFLPPAAPVAARAAASTNAAATAAAAASATVPIAASSAGGAATASGSTSATTPTPGAGAPAASGDATFLATVNLLDGTFKSLRLPTATTTKECLEQLYRKLCKGIPTPPKVEAVRAEYQGYGLFVVNADASKRALATDEVLLATCGKDPTFVFAPSEQEVSVTSLASVQAMHGHRFTQQRISKPKKCTVCRQALPLNQDIIACSTCKLRIHSHCSLTVTEQCRNNASSGGSSGSGSSGSSRSKSRIDSKADSADVRRRLSIAPAESVTPGTHRRRRRRRLSCVDFRSQQTSTREACVTAMSLLDDA